jgi:hypothetical protein
MGVAYTRQCDPTVTTFGCCRKFSDVVVNEFPARGFDDSAAVGNSIVGLTLAKGHTLSHCELSRRKSEL